MKPVVEHPTPTSVKINFTKPFIVWTVFFAALALIFMSWTLAWVAAAPWIIGIGLTVLLYLMFLIILPFAYMSGAEVTLRFGKKTKVFQRGR